MSAAEGDDLALLVNLAAAYENDFKRLHLAPTVQPSVESQLIRRLIVTTAASGLAVSRRLDRLLRE